MNIYEYTSLVFLSVSNKRQNGQTCRAQIVLGTSYGPMESL